MVWDILIGMLRERWKTSEPRPARTIEEALEEIERSNRICWALVKATDPEEISRLEARFGVRQENAVVHFVEQIEWGIDTFPQYQDGQGSFHERLAALRSKLAGWDAWENWKEAE